MGNDVVAPAGFEATCGQNLLTDELRCSKHPFP